jgi:hypothetical protein
MKWVEIATLRSPGNINREVVDGLLKGVGESDSPTDTPRPLVEIETYHNSVVETDLSIHDYWIEEESLYKSPLGRRIASMRSQTG